MNEISKKLKCLVMRNGITIWREEERLNDLISLLSGKEKVGFIKVDDELINSADVSGIFTAQTMEEMTRRKNGQWKCDYNNWHDRNIKCGCKEKKLEGEDLAKFSRGF